MGQVIGLISKLAVFALSPLAHQIIKENVLEGTKREQRLEFLQSISDKSLNRLRPKKCESSDVGTTVDFEYGLCPLTPKQNAIVDYSLDKTRNLNTVVACKFGINITRKDMSTLSGLHWLNDEIINFYMNLIMSRGQSGRLPTVYTFNTFFFTKLIRDGPVPLKRWTRKVNIFDYDMILVPIHTGLHWCLIHVDNKLKCITYYDSLMKPDNRCMRLFLNYLKEEHWEKTGINLKTCSWTMAAAENIPQQTNASDCGIFTCAYAEFLSRQAPIVFTQQDMPNIRKRMVVEIMIGELLNN